jgi:trimeric autotransporter adhesin
MQFRGLVVWSCAGLVAACGDNASVDPPGAGPGIDDASADVNTDDPGDVPDAVARALAQRVYLKALDVDPGDVFGASVALSADGSTLAVGATGEDGGAPGADADPADDSAEAAGAVYVFRRHGKQWVPQAYLKAANPDAYDGFGISVALSADGSILAVGAAGEDSAATGAGGDPADNSAEGAGAVYVFCRHGNTWDQEAYLKASNTGAGDYFGRSVALSADGATLAAGAWAEASAATGIGGNQADDSASYAGAVYVFTRSGGTWHQEAYVKGGNTGTHDYFGYSVALSADGATLAVGAWAEASTATGINGNGADNSAPYTGAAYVFTKSGATWSQEAYIKASNAGADDYFGQNVALSADGSTLAVTASFEESAATGIGGDQADDSAWAAGAVYIFTRSGKTWRQDAYVKASNTEAGDGFGASVALSGDGKLLAVGATGEASAAIGIGGDQADDAAPYAGAVYVFVRSGQAWSQEVYVKASNSCEGDFFGWGVALSRDGAILAASAAYEESAATGAGGDQADDSATGAGALYVFDRLP